MAEDRINIGSLLSACMDVSKKAGAIIQDVWRSGILDIKDKGNDDPFTKADVESQQLIMGLLSKRWPALKMVGEEDCDIPSRSDHTTTDLFSMNVPLDLQSVLLRDVCVFIDPLDATKEYTLGNLEAVMSLIGIAVNGEAVAGVMYQPFAYGQQEHGRMIFGMKGVGAFGYEPIFSHGDRLIVTTTRSHSSEVIEEAIARIAPNEVIRVGGAGFKCLQVLNGTADLYLYPTNGTKKWDTCAPEAIMRSVGGSLTDKFGRNLSYLENAEKENKDGILVSMKNHHKFVEALRPLYQQN